MLDWNTILLLSLSIVLYSFLDDQFSQSYKEQSVRIRILRLARLFVASAVILKLADLILEGVSLSDLTSKPEKLLTEFPVRM